MNNQHAGPPTATSYSSPRQSFAPQSPIAKQRGRRHHDHRSHEAGAARHQQPLLKARHLLTHWRPRHRPRFTAAYDLPARVRNALGHAPRPSRSPAGPLGHVAGGWCIPAMGWRLLWLLCAGGAAWSKTLRGGFVSSAARLEPWRPVARFQFRGRCLPGSGTSAGKKRYGRREE